MFLSHLTLYAMLLLPNGHALQTVEPPCKGFMAGTPTLLLMHGADLAQGHDIDLKLLNGSAPHNISDLKGRSDEGMFAELATDRLAISSLPFTDENHLLSSLTLEGRNQLALNGLALGREGASRALLAQGGALTDLKALNHQMSLNLLATHGEADQLLNDLALAPPGGLNLNIVALQDKGLMADKLLTGSALPA